jgi:hypothetical protein
LCYGYLWILYWSLSRWGSTLPGWSVFWCSELRRHSNSFCQPAASTSTSTDHQRVIAARWWVFFLLPPPHRR